VFFLALDKQALCREQKKHSAEKTLGEEGFLLSVKKNSAKKVFHKFLHLLHEREVMGSNFTCCIIANFARKMLQKRKVGGRWPMVALLPKKFPYFFGFLFLSLPSVRHSAKPLPSL